MTVAGAAGSSATPETGRRLWIEGRVQGVGFRPFVYRLATSLGVRGEVRNVLGRVEIHATASPAILDRFQHLLIERAPQLAAPRLGRIEPMPPGIDAGFLIAASSVEGEARIQVPPDYFCCDDCLRELRSASDRRHAYPFINCTQCGPRYTLIRALPYDRPNTSMAGFTLCAACRREYEDPADRRFHAEPVACAECGPQLEFVAAGKLTSGNANALAAAIAALGAGQLVAVKGVGGYHLMCDAASDAAIQRLRQRKPRPHKPLAVMIPRSGDDGLQAAREYLQINAVEAAALVSPMRPIVLVRQRTASGLSPALAPGLAELGVMLPYSPLHQLLIDGFGAPLVATSGNISGEPVLTDAVAAGRRLATIADAYLHHDRPIVRPADDPVMRVIAGRARPLRLGRGCAPLEIDLPRALARPVLAVGGHLKNTVCLAWQDRAVISPHIGDMGTPRSLDVFEQVVEDLQRLYRVRAELLICDRHPGYTTTRWAERRGATLDLPLHRVWHHHAHAAAVAGENGGDGPWLVFAWDGVGLGSDGDLWGGEALYGAPGDWRRLASWRPFRLPGGDQAGREPWRAALALAWEAGFDWAPRRHLDPLLRQAWKRGINAPSSSAAGRLFDAVAALIGLLDDASFEGQGPMYLETLAATTRVAGRGLPLEADADGLLRSDWAPLLAELSDPQRPAGERAALWHASAALAIRDQALAIAARHPFARIGLCGGVFQNRVLSEAAIGLLEAEGFRVELGVRIPVNDAGISFGQVIEFAGAGGWT